MTDEWIPLVKTALIKQASGLYSYILTCPECREVVADCSAVTPYRAAKITEEYLMTMDVNYCHHCGAKLKAEVEK